MPDFGIMFLKLKYTDITQKHLNPKLNGYGVNKCVTIHLLTIKYILKLAGICGFCNVNICT